MITVKQNTRGDYTAEIEMSKLHKYITGGSLYAYGDTEKEAKGNLLLSM